MLRAAHPGGCLRLRQGIRRQAPLRRYRAPGSPPQGGPPGRRAFVSGKKKRDTKKTTVISDDQGRLLWTGAIRPGRMHDVTAVRTEGIEDLLFQHRKVRAEADSGYQGLARDFPDQITAPPKKPGPDTPPDEVAEWAQTRKVQSSRRICVEHAIPELKQWRSLQR
ncbi:transposase family protein [Micromonospora sp. NPDC050495]|uniref:transposase family protein n=1 Tax=Micromonospora sp. NPDC050495 TaxID=3154936 RepID=UPI0033F6A22E